MWLQGKLKVLIIIFMSDNVKIIAQNKKARFDYFVEEHYECGVVLEGTEVKSVKNGNVSCRFFCRNY